MFLGIFVLLLFVMIAIWLIWHKQYQASQPQEVFDYIGNVKIGDKQEQPGKEEVKDGNNG